MSYETTIPAAYMYHRRPWKSEQQHINEYLYKQGLPYRQNDMTDLHRGMQYVGSEPEPTITYNPDRSISVTWPGTPGAPRSIEYRKRPARKEESFAW